MSVQRETLKAELLAEAEQAIEAMLKQLPDEGDLSLRDMENAAGVLQQRLGQATVQTLLNQESTRASGEMTCPSCGGRMQRRGRRKKRLVTVRGEVELERAYYVCPKCGNKRFPPG
jgi:DNA-directed RNA polymerase subunit RPC12/RpoP